MGKKSLERRVYTKEFKAEAVALAEKREKPISQIAKNLGINENMLRRWMQASREMAGSGMQALFLLCLQASSHIVFSSSLNFIPFLRNYVFPEVYFLFMNDGRSGCFDGYKANGLNPQIFVKWTKAETEAERCFVEVPVPVMASTPCGQEILIEKGEVNIHIPLISGSRELQVMMEWLGCVI